jgi:TRAP-type uncharacterized transport system fused permease subunit
MRLGILAYIVPFLFIFSPSLLLMGSPAHIVVSAITAIAGCFLLGCGLVGYLFRDLSAPMRGLMSLAGVGLLIPMHSQYFTTTLIINIAGGILALILFLAEYRQKTQPVAASKLDAEAPLSPSTTGGQDSLNARF